MRLQNSFPQERKCRDVEPTRRPPRFNDPLPLAGEGRIERRRRSIRGEGGFQARESAGPVCATSKPPHLNPSPPRGRGGRAVGAFPFDGHNPLTFGSVRTCFAAAAIVLGSVFCLGCGGGKDKSKDSAVEKGKRALDPKHAATVEAFAKAIAGKDYAGAYGHMAQWYQRELTAEDFAKSMAKYRDEAGAEVKYRIRASEEDPAFLRDATAVRLHVGEQDLRERILDEAVIRFEGGGGSWTLTAWIIDDNDGKIRILSFYQDR